MKKRIAVALVALVMIVGCVVGGTLAWLVDDTDAVVNTFTYGDINIELDETDADNDGETKENEYKMVPGNTIAKDPYVTVKPGSEACWLFVEVVEGGEVTITDSTNNTTTTYTFDDFLSYAFAEGWTELQTTGSTKIDINDSMDGNETIILYRTVSATDASAGKTYYVLAGDTANPNGIATVNYTVTKQMMEAIKTAGMPTLTFKAYAVQSDNISDVTDAWTVAKNPTVNING